RDFIPSLGGLGATGVAVDAQHVYWGNNPDQFSGTIGRANLDGTSPNPSFVTPTTSVVGVAVDTNFLYWTGTGTAGISRANVDGTNPNSNFTGAGSANFVAVGD